MKAFSFLLLLSVLLDSCNSKPAQEVVAVKTDSTTVASIDSTRIKQDEILSSNDLSRIDTALSSTAVDDTANADLITSPIAISLWPDHQSIEKEKQNDSDGFYSMIDDYSYYSALARDTISQKGIEVTGYSHDKRYIVFKNKEKVVCTFDGNKMPDSWGIILFNGIDTPLVWNGTDITGAIKMIYKK